MGLNVGVTVKKQYEEYMSEGCNPKGTITEINEQFDTFLRGKFPDDAFSPEVRLQDAYKQPYQEYIFDVRLAYNWNGYDSTPMYLAILEYILTHFSAGYGIDMRVYHSP